MSLDESKLRAGLLWAGTDDGNLQISNDGGKNWTNIIGNVRGMPADSSVSHVELSAANVNTAYVAFDRHKFDDYRPYVFKTNDGGRSFSNISSNLPKQAYVHVVREDPKNPNVIYAGTELGVYVTHNGGGSWMELNMKNFPRVAVHDLLIHPRENDIILGTHGRSLWVFDDATPIQNLSDAVMQKDAHLFGTRTAYRFTTRFTRYGIGDEPFQGRNPPGGALISYYLKNKADKKTRIKLEIFDSNGQKVSEVTNLPKERGINRTTWNLSHVGARRRRPPTPQQLEFLGPPRGPQALPGTYTIKLLVNGNVVGEKPVEVRVDPTVSVTGDELKAQFDLAMKLRDMLSTLNDGLRMLDAIKPQITQIERLDRTRKDKMSADLKKSLAAYKKRVDAVLKDLAVPPGEGIRASSRFTNEVNGLYFAIGGGNAGPTRTMKAKFDELKSRMPGEVKKINDFIEKDTAEINKALQKAGLPFIVIGKPLRTP